MRRSSLPLCLAALSATLLAAPAVGAQQVVDEGALVIMRDGTVIGREEFVVRRGRPGGADGYTVTTTAFYPAERPSRTIRVAMTLDPDSQPSTAQFELADGRRETILMSLGPRRVITRFRTEAGESARESPGAERLLLTLDSVHAIYAIPPGHGTGPVRVISPRVARATAARVTDHGTVATEPGGPTRPLQHLSIETIDQVVHLWYDQNGRLVQVTIPASNIRAVRLLARRR